MTFHWNLEVFRTYCCVLRNFVYIPYKSRRLCAIAKMIDSEPHCIKLEIFQPPHNYNYEIDLTIATNDRELAGRSRKWFAHMKRSLHYLQLESFPVNRPRSLIFVFCPFDGCCPSPVATRVC